MSDRRYLANVLGLSIVPRVMTSVMTMVSLPLMLRAVGATEFGSIVYLGAIVAVLEAFVDGGVSSAAGKAIAAAREDRARPLRPEVMAWAKLQSLVACLGLWPLLGFSYVAAVASPHIGLSVTLLTILVVAAWITIAVNFAKAALRSLLAFRSLAVLDTLESILRSGMWIVVASVMPSALGLAIGGLVTAICLSVVGATLLWRSLRLADSEDLTGAEGPVDAGLAWPVRHMVRESLDFLILRVVTRSFQAVPFLVFGSLLGAEVVGVVGAFARVSDVMTFPFGVVGSALAVRAPGVVAKGRRAARALWDAVSRFMAGAFILAATVYFGSEILGRLLLPTTASAGSLVAILSITVVSSSVSSLIAPMADYIGALRRRNILMACFTLGQVPVIWFGARFGARGAIAAYATVMVLMTLGYVRIALQAFFPGAAYRLPSEVRYFAKILGLACLLAAVCGTQRLANHVFTLPAMNVTVLSVSLLWTTVLAGLMLDSRARTFFMSKQFLTFTS